MYSRGIYMYVYVCGAELVLVVSDSSVIGLRERKAL